ncbi:MAG: undecaprenyl-diphosphate phosphatase [Cucumibacter sp.]
MDIYQGLLAPLVLGILEGLTEFLPVSSTAHLLLAGAALGFEDPKNTFVVLIQLGAILAIVTVYFWRLVTLVRDALGGKAYAWRFALGVALASAPAAAAGVALHDTIKDVLQENLSLVSAMLIVGGVVLLLVDRIDFRPRHTAIYKYPLWLYLVIGVFQMLSLVPGVSRSGATIVGSLIFGADKRSAAEFTFFIALPIMGGAFGYDVYKNLDVMTAEVSLNILIGFVASFVVGALVVRYLLDFISRFGFAPFAWWRVIVGAIGLWAVLGLGLGA